MLGWWGTLHYHLLDSPLCALLLQRFADYFWLLLCAIVPLPMWSVCRWSVFLGFFRSMNFLISGRGVAVLQGTDVNYLVGTPPAGTVYYVKVQGVWSKY